jgi:CheY-like chemotaxis protein
VSALQVLVVDDDPSICAAYDEILRAEGCAVTTATSAADALSAVERLEGSIDVIVVDVSLGDSDCIKLSRAIEQKIGPRPTLYVSGWEEEFLNLSDAPGRWLVLQVPVEVPSFIGAIEWLAGRRAVRPGA